MKKHNDYLIKKGAPLKLAIERMDINSNKSILFVVDENDILFGSISDGDIRRGLIKGFTIETKVEKVMCKTPKFITNNKFELSKIKKFRANDLKLVPIIDHDKKILSILNFNESKSHLPVDSIIMAGGKGKRLKPLTNNTPKSLLKIGKKPLIEYALDHITFFGIEHIWVSLNYLEKQIVDHLDKSKYKNLNYLKESKPLGTIGAVSLIDNFKSDIVLILNSDLICNVDYELFLEEFIDQNADISILSIPYDFLVPFAVLENEGNLVKSFIEKPKYNFQTNGGIYLMKKEVLKLIPNDTFYNATDLIEKAISNDLKVISHSFKGYWIDIGRHDDFEKAKNEIEQVNFS